MTKSNPSTDRTRKWAMAVTCAALWLLPTGRSIAADGSAIGDLEVRGCVERALPDHSVSQRLALSVLDETGVIQETAGKLYWKKFEDGLARVYFRIEDSPQHAGVAVLMYERPKGAPDIYVYSPESRNERRIATSALAGPLLGTDFSYEDFALLQNLAATGEMRRLEDADIDGHPTFVVETIPAIEGSSYSRVRTHIDKQWCLPVLTQYFVLNGSLGKELRVERTDVREHQGRWVPFRSVMHNHKGESRTIMSISDIEIDASLSDDLFTTSQLRRGR